ncbi:MAG: PLD nuclease N-terminal domain-containing protein [Paracoccaceae bacterium]
MEYGLMGLLILIADIYAIYQTLTSSASGAKKIIWTLVIFFLPVLGFIAWLVAGPRGANSARI